MTQQGTTCKMFRVLLGTNQCPHQMLAFRKQVCSGHWQASLRTLALKMQGWVDRCLVALHGQCVWGMGSSLWFVPSMTQHNFCQSPQDLLVSWERCRST